MSRSEATQQARESIFKSIRSHLAASKSLDAREAAVHHELHSSPTPIVSTPEFVDAGSLAELFKENLELVDGHCIIAQDEAEVVRTLTRIISDLQQTKLRAKRIAISDSPLIERLIQLTEVEIDELAVTPGAADLFGFDVGITTAQAAIAETGTLVLDSAAERHRLASLVPPVHIAIVESSRIFQTLGETLRELQKGTELSPAITFVTGPSRTADIELTLAIGVHGPQELYVIILK